jgi:ABC-type branched-subunit amino acid transport system ATPase component/ABC-type branched-subunit amino acid transport system permease subunit
MRRLALRAGWVVGALLVLLAFNGVYGRLLEYWQDIVIQCGIAVILAVSLNIVNGFTGQFSIGHAGFMAVGAYAGGAVSFLMKASVSKAHPNWASDQVLAALTYSHPWLLPAAMLVGGVAAALFGWLVGVPSLRLRGDYLAIVTLGFGEIIRVLLENANRISPRAEFLGGSVGFFGVPRLANFLVVYATAVLVVVLTRNLKVSLHGLAYQSIREDEIAADAMGVNTTQVKVTAFALGAFFAGVGGALFAHSYFIVPKTFNFILSINYVVMIVLGGTGSITGACIAAVVLTVIPELLKIFKDRIPGFKDEYRLVIYALMLILMMLLRPQGVFGRAELSPAALLRRWRGKKGAAPNEPAAAKEAAPAPAAVATPPRSAEILRVLKAQKVFGGLTAVSDLTLTLKHGELVGLIGPNGAGKTTVFNLLTGVYEPTTGTIHFEDRLQAGERPFSPAVRWALLTWDTVLAALGGWIVGTIIASTIRAGAVTWVFVAAAVVLSLMTAPRRRRNRVGYKPYEFAARGIARTFQNIRLFPELTVLQNVMIGSYLRRRTHLWDALFRTRKMEIEDAEVEARARALLARFELEDLAEESARNLPYGAQRRLEIARALATHPRLLLLDEPAAGMNPQEKTELMEDVLQIRREFGLTILLIEHDMKVVMGICERIYVLDYGEIIAEGTPEVIRRDPKVIAAYLGEAVATC